MVLPYSMRLTGVTGQVVTGANVVTDLVGHHQFDLGDQFAPCSLFSDGFEHGGTLAWSVTVP